MVTNQRSMPGAERNDSGKYTDKYPPESFTDALRELGGAAGTQDIADAVGCKYDTAYKKLRTLEDEGRVTSQKVANARLWQVGDNGDD